MKKKIAQENIITPNSGNFLSLQLSQLQNIAAKRCGGAINITGINFQLLYSIDAILNHLNADANNTVRLEGIEDLDLVSDSGNEFIQVKTSREQIDASQFWNLKILQNFYTVYKVYPSSRFRIVHNTQFKKGFLDIFSKFSNESLAHWHTRFAESNISISSKELKDMITQVTIERASEKELMASIIQKLHSLYNVNNGTELSYLRSLFFNVFEWAKKREVLTHSDLKSLIQSITDSFSKFPVNPVIQNGWLIPVSYKVPDESYRSGYFEGKAARPADIALGLNISRPVWEKVIEQSIHQFDVTVIKSSSGQGKSTLAFQVGKNLQSHGRSIYKVEFCPTHMEANHLYDFILTRVSIGESPVIIFDSLSQDISGWGILCNKLNDTPAKIIITTREEDWNRYFYDLTNLALNEINISLSQEEAHMIYLGLKSKNKLSDTVHAWQPVWERVKDSGLLIEYVFLLTQGQMIYDRLIAQIKRIASDPDSGVKLEILRLISLADILNIRLRTDYITSYIAANFKLTTDRNEIYKQLSNEYYINFDDLLIQGLHPVRSQHLVTILNSHISIESSLTSLLSVTSPKYVYDYFMNVLIELPGINKSIFFERAAAVLVQRSMFQVVCAIDGIMHSEPYQYWLNNRGIMDEAFLRGGFMFFIYSIIPFKNHNIIDELIESAPENSRGNLIYLKGLVQRLPAYSVKNSSVYAFVSSVNKALATRPKITTYESLSFLYKWFRQMNIPFPDIIDIKEDQLLSMLEHEDIIESSDAFNFYYQAHPDKYKIFSSQHRSKIIGWLKRKTETLSITEQGDDIHMNYLLDANNANMSQQSMNRIHLVHAFFPGYAHYCTKVIILNFPNEMIFQGVIMDSTKKISKENLFDNFDIHINRIWLRTIENQYQSKSVFEWQKQYYDFRILLIEVLKAGCRFFESKLQNDNDQIARNFQIFQDKQATLLANEFKLMQYPSGIKHSEESRFYKEENAIGAFKNSMRNFFHQWPGIFRANDFHLPVINLNSAIENIARYQEAFTSIANQTHSYFNFHELDSQETELLERLSKTVKFYRHITMHPGNNKIVVAKREVDAWWTESIKQEIDQLVGILNSVEKKVDVKIQPPQYITHKGSVTYAVIGLRDLNPIDTEKLFYFLESSIRLTETKIDVFTFCFISNNKTNYGLRLNRSYFRNLSDFVNGEVVDNVYNDQLLPIVPDIELIKPLTGVSVDSVQTQQFDNDFYKMMSDIWKLSEFRARLDSTNKVENQWLEEMTLSLTREIKLQMSSLSKNKDIDGNIPSMVERFLNSEIILSPKEIIHILTSWAEQIARREM